MDESTLPPLHEAFGGTRGEDGLWRLPAITPELASPHAALHLGPINVILERAAMDAAESHAGTDQLQVDSWTVMFVKPGTDGPFRAEAEVVSGRSERIALELTLYDEGKHDRCVAVARTVHRRL